MSSVSLELEQLLNPVPTSVDPEDDDDEEATRARVEQGSEGPREDTAALSALRMCNAPLLSDTDRRYAGKKVTRKQLLMEGEEEEDDEEEDGDREMVELCSDEDDDDDDDDDEEESRVDFSTLTETMDDLGVSDDDDDGGDDDDDDGDDGECVRTFSHQAVDETVKRGVAVKQQLSLWDHLLEGRIKLQKALVTANQLPQPDTWAVFRERGGAKLQEGLKDSHKAVKALQRSMLELQDLLLLQNNDTRAMVEQEEEQGVELGKKRKLQMSAYPELMSKRFRAFQSYRDATLQRWDDKTRLTTGTTSRTFSAFHRNILTQVDQVLMDQDRLLHRTRTRRSDYRVLGKMEPSVEEEGAELSAGSSRTNKHLQNLDEDIFDDEDFYHQLLRELIDRRTSGSAPNQQLASGRQWLAIQKLRSSMKKKVDTKASKGRKVRFHIHSKLVHFMAPVDQLDLGHAPKDQVGLSHEARNELYRGLFGHASNTSAPQ
ncbi:protein AATF [Gouania willdenowi]|uniref:protein AATF n=1 Tax=Gouania willdenowi TaxID=441366 RepID=UPI0010566D32|nr:protein AATF [Gouania willdenowi]